MDRRILTRYDITDYYEVVDRVTNQKLGRLANLSIEGAMLISDQPIKKRSNHKLTIIFSKSILGHKQIDIDAECRWCRKGKGVDWFESGFKLINVPIEDQTTIMCLVLQIMSDGSPTPEPA
jgi:hypothetical protein